MYVLYLVNYMEVIYLVDMAPSNAKLGPLRDSCIPFSPKPQTEECYNHLTPACHTCT